MAILLATNTNGNSSTKIYFDTIFNKTEKQLYVGLIFQEFEECDAVDISLDAMIAVGVKIQELAKEVKEYNILKLIDPLLEIPSKFKTLES